MKTMISVLLLAFVANAWANQSTRFLLQTFNQRSEVSEQVAAARALVQFSNDNEVQRSLLGLVRLRSTDSAIKIAAINALCFEAVNQRTWRELISQYQIETDHAVKVALVKSLYNAAASNQQVRRFIIDVIERSNDNDLIQAGLFAIAPSAVDSQTARMLVIIMRDQRKDDSVRVEAIKALYYFRNSEILRELQQVAQTDRESLSVRVAAIKLLQVVWGQSSSKENFFMQLAERDSFSEVRIAALDALRPQMEERDIRWFHLPRDPQTGRVRFPLED